MKGSNAESQPMIPLAWAIILSFVVIPAFAGIIFFASGTLSFSIGLGIVLDLGLAILAAKQRDFVTMFGRFFMLLIASVLGSLGWSIFLLATNKGPLKPGG